HNIRRVISAEHGRMECGKRRAALVGLALLVIASGCGRAAPMAICMPAATAPMSTGEPPILTVEDIPVQASLRRPYNHTATIAALPDGELLVAWGAGTKELDADTAIHVTRRSTAGAWGDAGILVDTPGRPDANCVLFLDDGGMLHLYWVAV